MRILFILIFFPFLALGAEGKKGFVKIKPDREIYVDWSYAKPGFPTVVLINGLTYSTRQWEPFTKVLVEMGIGVLRFDPMGMGETLLKYAPVVADIAIEDQVEDLRLLLKTLKVPKPYHLAGLSYGGGFGLLYSAKYPKEIGKLIAFAPYTEPMAYQDQWIQAQIWYTRKIQPWNPATDDELYAFFFRQIAYATYPFAEPVVLENPYKLEAIVQMALGIRKFSANKIVSALPPKSLHLIIAENDQYIPRSVMEDFWENVPEAVRSSKTIVKNSEHKIPEAVPRFSASLIKEILMGNPAFGEGRELSADPFSGEVSYHEGSLELSEE